MCGTSYVTVIEFFFFGFHIMCYAEKIVYLVPK